MDQTVSVIIPVFNRTVHLAECIESVERQTRPMHEIIVVDDCSTPEAAAEIDRFAGRAKIIHRAKNGGPAAARNDGVAAASGHWIAFLDNDDIWEPAKIEEQIRFFEEHPDYDAVQTGVVVFWPDGSEKRYLAKPELVTVKHLMEESQITPSSLMMRASVFRSLNGFNESFCGTEDYEFSFRLVRAGHRVGFIAQPLTRFRRGVGDNLSSRWWPTLCGQVKVVWRHRDVYREKEGRHACRRHIGKHMISAGYRRGGLFGQVVKALGKVAQV